jgi:flavin reductase (DIM6/NTAB) family NADH-FMN oxidoreductase RutF
MFKSIDPATVSTADFHALLLGAVAPRPIAFASTVDVEGNVNLSPFSFFNCFSAKPPVLVFSPARRVRDNTTKHTLENCLATKQVVINIGNFNIVEQMSLASVEYPDGVDEFLKSGLTPVASEKVKPPRVAECFVSFECEVQEVIHLGQEGGAGNLIICKVLLAHVNGQVLDDNGKIDPFKMDYISRLGGDWYARIIPESLFEVPKPVRTIGIGYDQLPEHIRQSTVLTGNNLGRLGNVENTPTQEETSAFRHDPLLILTLNKHTENAHQLKYELHILAQQLLSQGKIQDAWKVLLQAEAK